jgi:hypothetical protein
MDRVEPKDSLDDAVDFLKDGFDSDLIARILAIRHGLADAKEEVRTALAIFQNPHFQK